MVAYTTCATVHPDSPAAHHAEKTGNTYLCMCKKVFYDKKGLSPNSVDKLTTTFGLSKISKTSKG